MATNGVRWPYWVGGVSVAGLGGFLIYRATRYNPLAGYEKLGYGADNGAGLPGKGFVQVRDYSGHPPTCTNGTVAYVSLGAAANKQGHTATNPKGQTVYATAKYTRASTSASWHYVQTFLGTRSPGTVGHTVCES